jgi:hypothetical protein
MTIESFKSALRYSVRNPEVVTIGGGEFSSKVLLDVLELLDSVTATEIANTALRRECEALRGGKERFRLEAETANAEANGLKRDLDAARKALRECERAEVAATAEIEQARAERDASHVARLDAERLRPLARAIGQCRALDVPAAVLAAYATWTAGDDIQADTDRKAACLEPSA